MLVVLASQTHDRHLVLSMNIITRCQYTYGTVTSYMGTPQLIQDSRINTVHDNNNELPTY